MPETVNAIEIVRQSQQGYSIKPFIIRADDGYSYFVKGLAKSGGPALISEAIGAELGRSLELPIPPWRLMNIPPALIGFSTVPNVEDLAGGLAFASRAVESATDYSLSSINSTPIELRRKILLFDWWIRNEDRCLGDLGGNVNLILDGQGHLNVIDHNLAFDRTFSCDDFISSHVFRDCRAYFRDYVTRQECSQMLHEAMSNWGTITGLLPEDWIYRDKDQIDLTEPTLADRLEILEGFREERFWGPL
ncbi:MULTISPECIES: HipA family kinase [Pseudomonas fluorescens group]|jgi:hypothetical protein|uniref:HipA family kinase n=1 Tax=Pseudomonas TaxID=286 RepID=UPI000937BA21|nr:MULTISPECIES: HipA family kinase [Pseudomonas fluorescens group]OJT50026.1 hypothetical protein BSZ28_18520 [Pseudomonas moraviensis]VVO67887.1 hypothetical protein PS865_01162 [Pseudomonas fluorescens]